MSKFNPRKYGSGLSIGWSISGGMFIFLGAGWWFDDKYETSPYGMLGGVVLAFLFLAYEIWKTTLTSSTNPKDSDKSLEKEE